MYKILQGGTGIPNVYWYGAEGECNVMVMDLLGPTLEELFTERCGGRFSLKTILYIADQALRRIEYIHSKNFVHRDIKPENFAVGLSNSSSNSNSNSNNSNSSVIYCIDFGLAKRYRDETHAHVPYREGKRLTGTARYASINTHLGVEQSRRDDLESLAYVLLYFARGSLPWQGIRAPDGRDSTKFDLICDMKRRTTPEDLCAGLPEELMLFLAYARALHFEDKPDYAYLHALVKSLFLKEGLVLDHTFDWALVQAKDAPDPEDDQASSASLPSTSGTKHRSASNSSSHDNPRPHHSHRKHRHRSHHHKHRNSGNNDNSSEEDSQENSSALERSF